LVFDCQTNGVRPFNDSPIWEKLLGGAEARVIEHGEDPLVFCLEPGANYRLTKRSFYVEQQLAYPEGLLFEDSPVHFKMLGRARRIGMVDVPYYWYRVNHPGKITYEKTERRFEILEVAHEAISRLKECEVNPEQGGAALYGLFRLGWWCGTMVPPARRAELFQKACALWSSQVPEAWGRAYSRQNALDERHFLLGSLFLRGEWKHLEAYTYNRNRPVAALWYMLKLGRLDLLIQYGFRRISRLILGILRRAWPGVGRCGA
jgi:hypothetical protein